MYLLTDNQGYYKIGRAKNVDNRMGDFSTQWRVKAKLLHVLQTDNMIQLESDLHRRFASKRQNGEWFKLSRWDVREIMRWKG